MKSLQWGVSQPGVTGFIFDCNSTSAFSWILKKPVCSAEELTRHVTTPSEHCQKHHICPFRQLAKLILDLQQSSISVMHGDVRAKRVASQRTQHLHVSAARSTICSLLPDFAAVVNGLSHNTRRRKTYRQDLTRQEGRAPHRTVQ